MTLHPTTNKNHHKVQLVMVMLVSLWISPSASAQAPVDHEVCKSICKTSKAQCVNKIGDFFFLRNAPDTKSHDISALLQSRADIDTVDTRFATELKHKCDDTHLQCKMACMYMAPQ